MQLQLSSGNHIAKVNIAGRPIGLFGTEDKKHSTAWITFEEGARAALKDKTIPEAVAALDRLYNGALALPGAKLVNTLTPDREREFNDAKAAADTAKAATQAAQAVAEKARTDAGKATQAVKFSPGGAPKKVRDAATQAAADKARANATALDLLQRYACAYLTYRNFVPLSAADIEGQGPGGKSEGGPIDTIKNYQASNVGQTVYQASNVGQTVLLRTAFWGLLDAGTVQAIRQGQGMNQGRNLAARADSGKMVDPDVPGADLAAMPDKRTADIIRQHLMTMQTNFPAAYAQTAFDLDSVAEAYLNDTIKIPAAQTGAIANMVGPLP